MKVRTWVVAGAALAMAAIGSAAVLMFERAPDDAPSMHGNFERRFQPQIESLGITPADRDRVAAIGSVRDLRPVELAKH